MSGNKKCSKPKYVIETGSSITMVKNKNKSITQRSNFIKEALKCKNQRDLSDPSRRAKKYFEVTPTEKAAYRLQKYNRGTCGIS